MSSNGWDISTIRAPLMSTVIEESYALVVLDGAQAGLRCVFNGTVGSRLLVGKGPACDLRLEDPMVSRRHAVFEIGPKGVRLTDLESTNGTTINGVSIHEAYVRDGDRVRVAQTTLHLQRGEPKAVPLPKDIRFGRMLGASPVMRRLYPLCRRFAESELPVLIEGETGTGKEVLAEALHEASRRAKAPFVVFDCTAVPPNLMESTLFGHERGSFTGAFAPRKGVFEEAHGGTLFIDELGELDLPLQPKLLRALERGEVQRVGSNQWMRVDVRVIAATRRDLDREVQAGRFRDDLFFRLAVGRIELPPLRDRTGDVGLLACQFWQALGGSGVPMPEDLIQRFEDYRWPGNVRELRNAVARALALGETALAAENPPGKLDEPPRAPAGKGDLIEEILATELPLTRARERLVSEFERKYVERVLARHDGNVVRAAAASGIARRYFQILRARHTRG
ncbi:sigma 54-interacting transcriptional regulator [Pendulispora albinea]|uniref:Sigma 54-interacting transcriptional regulator n=1 Tax=Pendulispora albinea TaxID=2741071 RepID=A0ABZ2M147_9BACT